MDPDLMAEYAKLGMLSRRDSQFVDGLIVDFVVKCDKSTFEQHSALYKDEDTNWSFPAKDFDGVEEFVLDAYMAVSYKRVSLLARLSSGKEVKIFNEEHAERKKTYRAETEVEGKTFFVKMSFK